jgi:AraC-like DNA-binding protein
LDPGIQLLTLWEAAGVGVALVIAIALLGQTSKGLSRIYLAIALIAMAIDLAGHVVNRSGDASITLAKTAYAAGYVPGPMFLFYMESLTNPISIGRGRLVLHLTPALVAGGLVANLATVDLLRQIIGPLTDWTFQSLQQLQQVAYGVAIFCVYRKHRRMLLDRFSTIKGLDLSWIRNFAIALAILTVCAALNTLTGRVLVPNLYFGASLLILYVGYKGLAQSAIYVPDAALYASVPATTNSAAATETTPRHLSRIVQPEVVAALRSHLETAKPYLDSNLTLTKLARQLGQSTHTVSATINSGLGKTFYDVINEFRIAEAKLRLAKAEASVLDIAYAVGFNSKSTFYSAFRRFEGCTPAEFRNRTLAETTSPDQPGAAPGHNARWQGRTRGRSGVGPGG